MGDLFSQRIYTIHVFSKKSTSSFLFSFPQTAVSPKYDLFAKVKKISIFSIYVLSAQRNTQMISNILNVIFPIPIIIGDLYPLLYFNFYTLWPNTGWPRKSLIEEETRSTPIMIITNFTNIFYWTWHSYLTHSIQLIWTIINIFMISVWIPQSQEQP